jgi:hypothetical protein
MSGSMPHLHPPATVHVRIALAGRAEDHRRVMATTFRRIVCPVSGHTLFKARGQGTEIEIVCKCKRLVRIAADSTPTIHERPASGTR